MTAKKLRAMIDAAITDIEFTYKDIPSSICPFLPTDIAVAFGSDRTKDYNNLDDVMNDPFWDGKSLNEIAHELEMY